MTAPRSHGLPSPTICAVIVIAMLAMIVIPAAITLHSVHSPAALVPTSQNPTPYGYTWSLLLFVVPVVVIAVWLLPSEELKIPKRAFGWTIAILVPLGCLLDVVFAQWFFEYPNTRATLGILAPAFGPWVPVEEYVFYATGFLAILLLYIWLGEFWLAAYNLPDYPGEALRAAGRSVRVSGLLYCSDRWGLASSRIFLSSGEAVHQLACPQPHSFLNRADQPAVGSDSGRPLQLVELSARSNDGSFYRSLVEPAHRRSLCVDRRNLCYGDRV